MGFSNWTLRRGEELPTLVVSTLKTDVVLSSTMKVLKILASCCNACCCSINVSWNRFIGCGVYSAEMSSWTAYIATSVEDNFDIGKFLGKYSTVSDVCSANTFRMSILWQQ